MGERTRKKYQLADRVNIKVVRVDIETSKIDFALASERLKVATTPAKAITDSPATKPAQPVPALQKKQAKHADYSASAKTKSAASVEAIAKTDKKVITVTSANPPTTPLAGFSGAGMEGKGGGGVGKKQQPRIADVKPKPADKKVTTKQTAKSRSTGALLNKKMPAGTGAKTKKK
jgi:ribonuclease R